MITRYNVPSMIQKRSDQSSYHMPGGRTFRNQFINLKAGEAFGPFVSGDELIVTCYKGECRLEAVGEESFTVYSEGGIAKGEKATTLSELDQAIVDAGCRLKIVSTVQGTVQIVGTPGRAESAEENKK
jgi:hypothetical protein